MGSGMLTGRFNRARAESLPDHDWRSSAPPFNEPALTANLEMVEVLKGIAAEVGCSLPELAVAWTLSVTGVTGAIVGARNAEQVEGWIGAGSLQLTDEHVGRIQTLLERSA